MITTFQYVLKARFTDFVDNNIYWVFSEPNDSEVTILKPTKALPAFQHTVTKDILIPFWLQKGDKITTVDGNLEIIEIYNDSLKGISIKCRLFTQTKFFSVPYYELKNTFLHFITDNL